MDFEVGLICGWKSLIYFDLAGTVKPIHIETADGLVLGGWHIIPRRDACELPRPQKGNRSNQDEESQLTSLDAADLVFLYFHGNAGNRATYHRTSFYKVTLDIFLYRMIDDYFAFQKMSCNCD